METLFQLAALAVVITSGIIVVVLLAARKGNLLFIMNLTDNQVFTELSIRLFTGVLALRILFRIYG